MKIQSSYTIWAVMLGVWFGWTAPAIAHAALAAIPAGTRIEQAQPQPPLTISAALEKLAQAQVVYLAETHEQAADHQAQLEILRSLQPRRSLIIGMEMFQRPFQWAINQYLAGTLSETDLLQQTEYQQRWGYDWELYAPILRFARQQQIPVIALNTPSEVTRRVARSGLAGLTLAEQQWIPPRSAIRAEPEAYRQRIRQIYDDLHQGKGSSASFDNFFLAQVLWDETMADAIATTLQRSPNALIVVLAGQGHILYGQGIPQRVARRLNPQRQTPLQQVTVLLNPDPSLKAKPGMADLFWHSP